jgi:hypothetical protein
MNGSAWQFSLVDCWVRQKANALRRQRTVAAMLTADSGSMIVCREHCLFGNVQTRSDAPFKLTATREALFLCRLWRNARESLLYCASANVMK